MSLETFCRKPLVKVELDTSITEACELMGTEQHWLSRGRAKRETVRHSYGPRHRAAGCGDGQRFADNSRQRDHDT